MILVTAAILTVQSQSSMLQSSYAQSCPDGSPVDASGNCATMPPPPAGDGETTQAQSCPEGSPVDASGNCPTLPPPPAGDGETAQAPPPATTETPPPPATAPPATTETPPPPATEAPPAGASQVSNNTGGMSADWINSILAVHNSERAAVGVPPLVWNNSLAAGAQTWAEHVSQTGAFAHATDAEKGGFFGESIAGFDWSDGPTAAPDGGTSLIVAEKSNYVPGTPINSGTIGPNGGVYGHYTQMVWRNTQEVGCGAAPPGAGRLPYSILVCRYNPPGNIGGQVPY
jgi:hypothetical protein